MSRNEHLQKILVINGWSARKSFWSKAVQNLSGMAEEVEILDIDCLEIYESFDSILQNKVKPNTLIIGWSLGTQMAIASLLKSKELVQRVYGLIALQSTPCFIQKDGWRYGYPAESFNSLQQSCVDEDFVSVKRVFAYLLTQGSDSSRDDRKFLKKEYLNSELPEQQVLLKGLDLLKNNDLRDRLDMLSVKTLWLLGEDDALVSAEIKAWLDKFEQFQVEVIGGMGHYPCGVYWRRVFGSIQRFIEVK